MTVPPIAEIVVALLLLASGGIVLTAALGLLRLPDFFLRMHAPALASTLATWLVSLASIVHFSTRGQGVVLHVWLIVMVLAITAPVTTIVLARAAFFRGRPPMEAAADGTSEALQPPRPPEPPEPPETPPRS